MSEISKSAGSILPALLLLASAAACGGGASAGPEPSVPHGPPGAGAVPPGGAVAGGSAAPGAGVPAAPVDPWALPDGPRDDEPIAPPSPPLRLDDWERALKAKGVAAPPASCAAAAAAAKKAGQKLADVVRAAETGPVECADAVVDPHVRGGAASELAHVLVGLSLAGKLSRTANAPPVMGAIREKEKVKAFIAGPLKTWLVEQATAIETLASGAAGLTGYGRGVAAMEAGVAEMRLVDKMRSSPVPATWDPELKAVYEAALDEALEPRKRRGRDAALIGMSDFAQAGILKDDRLDRARALLAKLYGGRRIDALDGLLVLPRDPAALPGGVTPALRARFRAGDGPADATSPYARARLDLGRLYWRRIDFVEAAHAAKASKVPEDRLVLALALALVHAPNGAAAMMSAPSPASLTLTHTEALDALAKEGGPLAGMAAYDAAHLRSLSPPDGDAAPAHLRDVAARFRKAEGLLTDAAQKKRASERASELDAVAAAAEKKGRP